jgi:hypothetical protein
MTFGAHTGHTFHIIHTIITNSFSPLTDILRAAIPIGTTVHGAISILDAGLSTW